MALEPEERVEETIEPTKRLQTQSSHNADKARIVVTLHVEMELKERAAYAEQFGLSDKDAVTVLRHHVAKSQEHNRDANHPSLQMVFLSGLLENSVSMEVHVAK